MYGAKAEQAAFEAQVLDAVQVEDDVDAPADVPWDYTKEEVLRGLDSAVFQKAFVSDDVLAEVTKCAYDFTERCIANGWLSLFQSRCFMRDDRGCSES